jgi:lipopolysaccharide export system protein LptA
MVQGDTLSLVSDYAYYDGNDQLAQARYNVVLKHRKTTLYTDSLDYDRMYSFGNFFEGGKMVDGKSVLTSDWGEYHTDSKMAMFYYDVRLKDQNMFLTTDSLYYDTRTSRAHIVGPSNITSGSSHIYSEMATIIPGQNSLNSLDVPLSRIKVVLLLAIAFSAMPVMVRITHIGTW